MIASLVLSAAVIAFVSIRSMQQRRLTTEARRDGLAAYAAGDLKTALQKLEYFWNRDKTDLDVNLVFAEAKSRVPQPGGQNLLKAIDLYTNDGLNLLATAVADPVKRLERQREILGKLLKLHGQLGQDVEAAQTADRLLAIDPDSIEATAIKTDYLLTNRKFDEALPLADRLIKLEPDKLAWRGMYLRILAGQGMSMEQRVEQTRQWGEQYTSDGRFKLLTAAMLVEMDRVEEARSEMQSALKLGAATRDVLERSISLLELLDLHDQAGELVAATRQRFPTAAWAHEIAARRLWHGNFLEETLAEIEQAQHDPGAAELDSALLRLKAMSLVSLRRYDEVRTALAPLLNANAANKDADDDRAWASAVMAVIDPNESKWRETLGAVQFALALSPADAVLHFLMGDVYARGGEQSQALTAYRLAYDIDPDWMAAGAAYTDALLAAGRIPEAFKSSRMVFSRSPKDRLLPFVLYARSYLALRQVGGGNEVGGPDPELDRQLIRMLEQVRMELPGDADVAGLLADLYVQTGAASQAAQLMNEIVSVQSPEIGVILALAEISRRHGLKMDEPLLDRGREIAGPTVTLGFARAETLSSKGDAAGGLKAIDEALAAGGIAAAQRRRAKCERAAYMVRANLPQAGGEMASLAREYPDSAEVMQFVLAQRAVWNDVELVAAMMANLKKLLGEQSPQVRLAEANFLLRHHGNEEPLLARAIVQINGVLDQAPDSLAALSLVSEAVMMGAHPDIDRAIEALDRAAGLYPAESSLLVRLVDLLQRKGDFDRAGRNLRALALRSGSTSQLRSAELRLLNSQGDFEAALVRAAALVNETSAAPDQLLLATIQHRAGKIDDAGKTYERLLGVADPQPLVLSEAAEFFASTGRFERGLELLQRINPQDDPAAKDVLLGNFYQRHERVQEAGECLTRAVRNDPESAEARLALARHLLATHQRPQAREQALAGLKIDPRHMALRTTLAIADLGSSATGVDRQKAIAQLRELGAENDDLLAMLLLLEQASQDGGKAATSDQTLAAAQRLLVEHGGFLPCWLLAISLNIDAGREIDAVTIARRAISRFPGQAEPSQWATQLLMRTQRWDDALVEAQEWRRRAVAEPFAADVMIASIMLELHRPDDASRQLQPYSDQMEQEYRSAPDRFAVWLRAAAGSSNQFDRAVRAIGPLLHADARWRELWLAIATELDGQRAIDSLAMLEPVVVEPTEMLRVATGWSMLGRRGGGECFQHADAMARKVGESPGFAVQSLIAQGAVSEARGDVTRAEALYRKAIQQEPDNAMALNNLAFVLAAKPAGCAAALPHIEKAIVLAPEQPDLLDTYAQVLLGLDRAQDAEAALKRALQLRPRDIGMQLTLLDAQIRQDRMDGIDQALNELQLRLRLQPHPDLQQQARLDAIRQRIQESQAAAGS